MCVPIEICRNRCNTCFLSQGAKVNIGGLLLLVRQMSLWLLRGLSPSGVIYCPHSFRLFCIMLNGARVLAQSALDNI